jgi:hypothetical protein
MRMIRLAGIAAIAIALAACSTSADPQPTGHAAPRVAAAEAVDCGTFTVEMGKRLPQSAAQCFMDAVGAGRSADLKVTGFTIEGDPVPTTFQADPSGRITVTWDWRQDSFGPAGVDFTSEVCSFNPSVTAERASADPTNMLMNC